MPTEALSTIDLFNKIGSNFGKLQKSIQQTVTAFEQLDRVPQAAGEWMGSGAGGSPSAGAPPGGDASSSQAAQGPGGGAAQAIGAAAQQLSGLQPVLDSINSIVEADLLGNLRSMGDLITKQIPSWLKLNWPILLVSAAIGIILLFLNQFGISAADIINMASQMFTWFFDLIMQGVNFLLPLVQQLWDVFLTALPIIGPLVLGLATAFGIYYGTLGMVSLAMQTVSFAHKIWSGLMAASHMVITAVKMAVIGFNAALMANPITVIISLIVGLIVAFLAIIAAVQPVRSFLADFFRWTGEMMSRNVGGMIDLVFGFVDATSGVVNQFLSMVSGIANAVLGFLGIKGKVHFEIPEFDTESMKAAAKKNIEGTFNAAAQFTEDFNVDNIKSKLHLDKLGKLGQPGGDAASVPPVPAMPDPKMPAMPEMSVLNPMTDSWSAGKQPMNIPKVNEVGKVGRIDNTIDVSSEDLKTMRELAEIKSIQNFVTLTPTVQVQTGDIRQEVDVGQMISQIEQAMAHEIASSAEGVYR